MEGSRPGKALRGLDDAARRRSTAAAAPRRFPAGGLLPQYGFQNQLAHGGVLGSGNGLDGLNLLLLA